MNALDQVIDGDWIRHVLPPGSQSRKKHLYILNCLSGRNWYQCTQLSPSSFLHYIEDRTRRKLLLAGGLRTHKLWIRGMYSTAELQLLVFAAHINVRSHTVFNENAVHRIRLWCTPRLTTHRKPKVENSKNLKWGLIIVYWVFDVRFPGIFWPWGTLMSKNVECGKFDVLHFQW